MPEIPLKNSPAIEQVRAARDQFLENATKFYSVNEVPVEMLTVNMHGIFIPWDEWTEFRSGLKGVQGLVGIGRDRTVIKHPYNPSRVVSVYHQPQPWYVMSEARSIHRALKILFPKNFPAVHSFFGYNDEYENTRGKQLEGFFPTGFVVDFIRGSRGVAVNEQEGFFGRYVDPENFRVFYDTNSLTLVRYPIQAVLSACDRIEFPLRELGFDHAAENFVLSDDGGEYCVDMVNGPFYSEGERPFTEWWDSGKVIKKIKEEKGSLKLDDRQVEQIIREIDPL